MGEIFELHESSIASEHISHYVNIPPLIVRITIAKGYELARTMRIEEDILSLLSCRIQLWLRKHPKITILSILRFTKSLNPLAIFLPRQ